jgi:hypothetical protein
MRVLFGLVLGDGPFVARHSRGLRRRVIGHLQNGRVIQRGGRP